MSKDAKIEELEATIIEKDLKIEELNAEVVKLEESAERLDKIIKGILNSK